MSRVKTITRRPCDRKGKYETGRAARECCHPSIAFPLGCASAGKKKRDRDHEITGISLSAFHRLKTAIFITLGVNVESVELKGKSRLFDEHGKQTVRSYYKIFDFGCFNREKIEQTYLQTGLRAEDDPDEQAERRKTVVNTVKAVNKYRAAYAMELFKIPEIHRS